jgi:hypothetical protein
MACTIMTEDHRNYQADLLRLWRINTDRSTMWHSSLEDPRIGVRLGFSDLKGVSVFGSKNQ